MNDKENTDTSDFVNFGDVARKRLKMQCQYASRYHGGLHGSPDLTRGLRILGTPADYHSMMIHKGDVGEFVKNVCDYWARIGAFDRLDAAGE